MRRELRERMAREVADWRHSGLIDGATESVLRERYAREGHIVSTALKWLGLFAVFQLGLSVLAYIAAASDSLLLSLIILALASSGVGWWGVRIVIDPRARHPITGHALVTLALAGATGSLILFMMLLDVDLDRSSFMLVMLATAALAVSIAYRYALRWPLLLGLLLTFHGLGAWHAYGGSGAYFAHIVSPELMAPLAFAFGVLGLWHEHAIESHARPRLRGFGHLYLILGLVYCNVPLWLLSLGQHGKPWVIAFTLAAIAQIVAGARLKDSRLTGFGVVFLAINLYTRYFEHFWDRQDKALLLIVAGGIALALGLLMEDRRPPS